jgi:hypothetical protein
VTTTFREENPMSTIDTEQSTRRTHPVHVGHLVMGLAFLGLVGIWAAVQYDVVSTEDVRWLLPLPWVFAGVAGLLAVLLSGRGRRTATPATPWTEPAPGTESATDDEAAIGEPALDPEPHPAADPSDEADQTDQTEEIQ